MQKHARGYLVAIIVTTVMVLLRWALEPWLHEHLLFAPLLGAVAIAVWYGGYRPALVSLAGGTFADAYFFLEPRGSFSVADFDDYVAIAMFVFTCAIVIGFGEAMRQARYRAEERQERLRTTLASIGDAVIATDLYGRVTMMNPVAESMTGWKLVDAAGQPMEAVFHIINEYTRQPVENPVQKVLELGRFTGLANHTALVAEQGTERPIDDSAAPIKCEDGEIVGCVLVFRDVSDRKQAEALLDARVRQQAMVAELSRTALSGESLQEFMDHVPDDVKFLQAVANILGITIERKQAEQALRAADRRTSEFLATLAHELRNPLAPVRNSLQMMRMAGSDSTVVELALDTMDRQTGQMVRLVDDNKDNARSLAMLLKITGHETRLAHDGLEAIDAAEKFHPDVVLLDIGLPRLNGLETCRRIREQTWGKDVTLVALTGRGREVDRRNSKDAGFDHHLVKPVEYADLLQLLGEPRPTLD